MTGSLSKATDYRTSSGCKVHGARPGYTQACDTGCVLKTDRHAVHVFAGLFDELGPTACTQMAPAIVQAWLADVGTTEQQQAEVEEQKQELQEAHSGLQHLLVAAACALRGKDSLHQQQHGRSGRG